MHRNNHSQQPHNSGSADTSSNCCDFSCQFCSDAESDSDMANMISQYSCDFSCQYSNNAISQDDSGWEQPSQLSCDFSNQFSNDKLKAGVRDDEDPCSGICSLPPESHVVSNFDKQISNDEDPCSGICDLPQGSHVSSNSDTKICNESVNCEASTSKPKKPALLICRCMESFGSSKHLNKLKNSKLKRYPSAIHTVRAEAEAEAKAQAERDSKKMDKILNPYNPTGICNPSRILIDISNHCVDLLNDSTASKDDDCDAPIPSQKEIVVAVPPEFFAKSESNKKNETSKWHLECTSSQNSISSQKGSNKSEPVPSQRAPNPIRTSKEKPKPSTLNSISPQKCQTKQLNSTQAGPSLKKEHSIEYSLKAATQAKQSSKEKCDPITSSKEKPPKTADGKCDSKRHAQKEIAITVPPELFTNKGSNSKNKTPQWLLECNSSQNCQNQDDDNQSEFEINSENPQKTADGKFDPKPHVQEIVITIPPEFFTNMGSNSKDKTSQWHLECTSSQNLVTPRKFETKQSNSQKTQPQPQSLENAPSNAFFLNESNTSFCQNQDDDNQSDSLSSCDCCSTAKSPRNTIHKE